MNKDKIIQECVEIYIKAGADGVMDYVTQNYPELPWGYCDACDTVVPYIQTFEPLKRTCLVCENEKVIPDDNDDEEEWW